MGLVIIDVDIFFKVTIYECESSCPYYIEYFPYYDNKSSYVVGEKGVEHLYSMNSCITLG